MEKLVEKKKHNHKLTNWLKVLIFSMVMLAPFFAVLSKVIYVQSNINAKDSYGIETSYTENIYEYETNEVDNTSNETQKNSLINNNIYLLTYTIEYGNTDSGAILFTSGAYKYFSIEVNGSAIKTIENINTRTNRLEYRTSFNSTNSSLIYGYYGNNFLVKSAQAGQWQTIIVKIAITFENVSIITTNIDKILIEKCPEELIPFTTITHQQTTTLDNVFYYAIEQLHEQPIFNWAKNTAIYRAINGMTTGLDMGANNTLALLLAYWSILIAVYIVFDIIIFIFTKITHFINE